MAWPAKLPSCAAVDIILISSRGYGDIPHWSYALAARAAVELAAAGNDVRWLGAVAPGAAPLAPVEGVETVTVHRARVGFRQVRAGPADRLMEVRVAQELRRRPADVVHVVGFGAGTSDVLLWLAERMGASPVVTLRASELLCHRRTLVDEQDRQCRAWADVKRCVECCLTPTGGGLSPGGARLGRLFQLLGPWSPYPNQHAFRSRLETHLAGVASAEHILVGSEADRKLMELAGIPNPTTVLDLEKEHGADLSRVYGDAAITI
jgi:hypothetical protein